MKAGLAAFDSYFVSLFEICPAHVYFAKLMRTLEDGLSCFNDPFENCETWIIMIQANQFGTQ